MHNKKSLRLLVLLTVILLPKTLLAQLSDGYTISNNGGSSLNVGTVTLPVVVDKKVIEVEETTGWDCDKNQTYYQWEITAPRYYYFASCNLNQNNPNCTIHGTGKGSTQQMAEANAKNNMFVQCAGSPATAYNSSDVKNASCSVTGQIEDYKYYDWLLGYPQNSDPDVKYVNLGIKGYYCTISRDVTVDKGFNQNNYTTDNGKDAYCLHPGKTFPANGNITETYGYNTDSCKTSNESYECILAAVATEAQKNAWSYSDTLLALRLMAAGHSGDDGFDSFWDGENLYGDARFYKESYTHYVINGGNSSSAYNGVIRGGNIDSIAEVLRNIEKGYNFWQPELTEILTDQKDQTVVTTYEINLDSNDKINSVSVHDQKVDHQYYSCYTNKQCLTITVPLSLLTEQEKKDGFEITIEFDSNKYVMSNIGIYTANNNPSLYQYFFVFDRGPKTVTVKPKIGPSKCEIKDDKYYDKEGKEITGKSKLEKEKKFIESCGCRELNGDYYGPDGKKLKGGKVEFEEVCPCAVYEDGVTEGGKKYTYYFSEKGAFLGTDEIAKKKRDQVCKDKCKIVEGKYYDKDGKLLNDLYTDEKKLREEFYKSCACRKEEKDGQIHYYSDDNEYLGYDEEAKQAYEDVCTCKNPDYHGFIRGKDAKILYSEYMYYSECPIICKIRNDNGRLIYYGKDGKMTTERVYKEECKPACGSVEECRNEGKTKDDPDCGGLVTKYYDANGLEVSSEKEMKESCTCVISQSGKCYNEKAEEVTCTYDIREFIKNKCSTEEKCELKDQNNVPTDCGSSTEGIIEDPSMCSILGQNTGNRYERNDYKTIYAYDNEYCDVYCRNEFKYTFMNKTEALAGRYFYYDIKNDNSRLSTVVKTTRQCTSLIDYDKWLSDYKAANDKVRTAYNSYAAILAQELTAVEQPESQTCGSCTGDCGCCGSHWEPASCPSEEPNCSQREVCDVACPANICSATTLTGTSWYWTGANYYSTDANGNRTNISVSGSDVWNYTCGCSCNSCAHVISNGSKPSSKSAQNEYDAAVRERDALVEKIKSCNFTDNSAIYNKVVQDIARNNVRITYQEPYNISTSSEVVSTSVARTYSTKSKWEEYCSDCEGTLDLGKSTDYNQSYWECSHTYSNPNLNSKCVNSGVSIPANKIANMDYSVDTGYFQNTKFSVNIFTGTINNYVGSDNSISLGERVYPVENVKTTYDKEITVNWSAGSYKSVSGTYKCYYNIIGESKIYGCDDGYHECPPDTEIGETSFELGYYFRTVDLDNLFNSQTLPSNWATNKGQEVKEKVEKTGNDIWTSTKPVYTVELSSSGISWIKKYNKNKESSGGYLDYSIECNVNTLRCKSTFLDEINKRSDIKLNKNEAINSIYYYSK